MTELPPNVIDRALDILYITGHGYNPKEMTYEEYVEQCFYQAISELNPTYDI